MNRFWTRYGSEVLVAVLVFVIVAPWGKAGGGNVRPRVALAAAIVEHGSVEITEYESVLQVDFAVRDGELYSDKAPGSSFVFVPIYALYKAATNSDLLGSPNQVTLLAKLVLASVPAGLLAGLIAWSLRGVSRRRRTWTALLLVGGTMLLPFGTVAFGHELAALLAFTAFLVARSKKAPLWTAFVAGAVVGIGVAVEYPVVVVAVGLLIYLAVTAAHKIVPFVLGGLPIAVALGAYHTVAFGNPLHTSYRYADTFQGEFSGLGLGWPDLGDLFTSLLGERGLFALTPIVLVALLGFVLARNRVPGGLRSENWLAFGIVAVFILLPAMWADDVAGPSGGWSPGPRFVVPALPFLAVPLARMLRRWPRITSVCGGISILVMVLATITDPLVPNDTGTQALGYWLELAGDGEFRWNLFIRAFGPAGILVHVGLVGAVGWRLIRFGEGLRGDGAPILLPRETPDEVL